jgi:hypothetical protein
MVLRLGHSVFLLHRTSLPTTPKHILNNRVAEQTKQAKSSQQFLVSLVCEIKGYMTVKQKQTIAKKLRANSRLCCN